MMANESISDLTNKVWAAADAMRAEGLLITDYMEQLSLFMFLKMVQEREDSQREQAEVLGGAVESLFDDDKYRWASWSGFTGPLMRDFLVHELFPYLQDRPGIVGKIFRDVALAIEDPGTLKSVVGVLDDINLTAFGFDAMGQMYEHFLRRLTEAGAAGEYFTYRHVIDFMVAMVDPKLGETIYDPACGTGGFLTRALEWVKDKHGGGKRLSAKDWSFLRKKAFWGHDVNRRTYRMGLLNMYLHGIDEPNLERIDTLGSGTHVGREYGVVLSNPPYGAKVVRENVRDFPVLSTKSQLLFLQHIMQSVHSDGRAAMIADEGLYFQSGAFARVRKTLLEEFEVRAVVSLPPGAFQPYTGVKTSIVFFWKTGRPTREVWFYELQNDGSTLSSARRFGPEFPNDIPDLLKKWPTRATSERSWVVPIEEIEENGFNLTTARYRPASLQNFEHQTPEIVIREALSRQQLVQEELEELNEVVVELPALIRRLSQENPVKRLGDVVTILGGGTPSKSEPSYWLGQIPWVSPKDMKVWEIVDAEDHISEEAVRRSAVKLIEPRAILVVVRGMILARAFPIAMTCVPVTINQDMKALIPIDELDPAFLAYVLKGQESAVLSRVETASHGTRRLNSDVLRALQVPLPPLEEQREVVALLNEVRERAVALGRLRQEAAGEPEAVLGSVLRRLFAVNGNS